MEFAPYRHKAQYYETDTMKIVHHSNYIRWMEEARVDLLEQMGLGYDKMEIEGVLSPVLSVQCEFKGMTRFAETVEIRTQLTKYTGVRFELSYEMIGPDGTLRARGTSAHCFIDGSGKPISLRRRNPAWDALFCRKFFPRGDESGGGVVPSKRGSGPRHLQHHAAQRGG